MKREVLKDLCARLPYEVKLLHIPTNEITNLEMIGNDVIDGNIHDLIEHFKPYLFPLSCITEENGIEYFNICNNRWTIETFDYCNRNHIDYRGLIEKGLAIDATGLNVY